MNSIIMLVIWGAVLQGFFLGIVFITSKKNASRANKLLGSFLIAFVFLAISDISPYDEVGGYSVGYYFTIPEVKWFLPVLFLHFVLEKVGRTLRYFKFIKAHYLLAVLIVGLTPVNLLLHFVFDTTLLEIFGWAMMDQIYMALQYYAFFMTIAAFVIAILETRRYGQRVKNESSDITMLDINWLWQFISLIAPMLLFWGAELLRIALGGKGQSELTLFVFLFIAFFNYFVSYKAFTNQTLFEVKNEPLQSYDEKQAVTSAAKDALDPKIYGEIEQGLHANKYYLDKNLTIHDLAKKVNFPARTISTYINQHAGCNFNEWVNGYRVEHALHLLNDQEMRHFSIEGIGKEAGFKSRSAMYTAFKKKTGQSPGQLKRT